MRAPLADSEGAADDLARRSDGDLDHAAERAERLGADAQPAAEPVGEIGLDAEAAETLMDPPPVGEDRSRIARAAVRRRRVGGRGAGRVLRFGRGIANERERDALARMRGPVHRRIDSSKRHATHGIARPRPA